MQINTSYDNSMNILESEIKAQQTEAAYQVKLMKMQQQSEAVVGDLLEDTAEISQAAMQKYLSEING